jgi:hypothetical protein
VTTRSRLYDGERCSGCTHLFGEHSRVYVIALPRRATGLFGYEMIAYCIGCANLAGYL